MKMFLKKQDQEKYLHEKTFKVDLPNEVEKNAKLCLKWSYVENQES